MAVWFILGAMAHERNGPALGQVLKEAKGEFLSVIFDLRVASVNSARFKQFFPVPSAELGPGNFSLLDGTQQSFTGAEVCHPDVIT
jgi:hypothetical protein